MQRTIDNTTGEVPVTDEHEELSLIEGQIEDLLEGMGASEDHADVLKFLSTAGLRPALAARVHKAIVCAEVVERPRVAPPAPHRDEMVMLFREAKDTVGIDYVESVLNYAGSVKHLSHLSDDEAVDMLGLLRMFKRAKWPEIRPQGGLKVTAEPPRRKNSTDILESAAAIQRQRAYDYDQPGGERSMARTVQAFNIITNRVDKEDAELSESEGWLLMQILKDVRDRSTAKPHVDSLEDCVSYSALKAEARLKE
jgi:hypothetical protein